MRDVRTWVEIDERALRHNMEQFLRLIRPATRFMAVVKSNAYGHGLSLTAKVLSADRRFTGRGWFGVDSITEALRLRRDGIRDPILVLGYTLPARLAGAFAHDIAVSAGSFEAVEALASRAQRPTFHIKLDTGMCRQGFLAADMPRLADVLRKSGLKPAGLFTHFAAAKDPDDRVSTQRQIAAFSTMADRIGDAIHDGVIRHASASGGTLLFPEAHLDMVRVGMGLYGYWPSRESRKAEQKLTIALKPVLSWKSVVAETKQISKGSRVGYDGVERVRRATRMAVVPVGYWHGYDRGFSKKGVMLVRGRRARVLGRVSMDMTVIDITGIPGVCTGDEVVLIGADGGESIYADELAGMIGTTAYEFLTRINPLIRRVGV